MNSIRNLALTVTLSLLLSVAAVGISGCMTLDGILSRESSMEQAYDPADGLPWFVDSTGNVTKEPVDPITGEANAPHKVRAPSADPSGAVNAVTSLASTFGPWGLFIGTTIGGVVAVYLKGRRSKLLGVELDHAEALNAFLIELMEKVKTGSKDLLDAGVLSFIDGKPHIDTEKFKEWLRKQGKEFGDPEYLAKVVREVTEAL